MIFWQYHDIGFESQTKEIGGVNIWKHQRKERDVPSFKLSHPQYPNQIHKLRLYISKPKVFKLLLQQVK
jgi:hypothetical protein